MSIGKKYTVWLFVILLWLLFTFYSKPSLAASNGTSDRGADLAEANSQVLSDNSYPGSKGNLGNEVLYHLVVERFFDGNPDNNIPNYAFPLTPDLDESQREYNRANRILLRHSFDPTHRYVGLYWGGDLEGVIQKLDYLKDLGVTKIILSPIQDNANGIVYASGAKGFLYVDKHNEQPDNFYAHASSPFHGSSTKDWFEIDEHFRNPQDETGARFNGFRQLLDEAGKRGIGIVLELTINDTSPLQDSELKEDFNPDGNRSWYVDNGAIYRHGTRVATYSEDGQGWFHPSMAIDFNRPTQEMIENGMLGGMPDLNQDAPEVEQYLLDAVKFWLNFNEGGSQIAGFCFDLVKYTNISFWQKLEAAVIEENPAAILIAAYSDAGYRHPDSIDWYKKTNNYTVFNFDLSMPARKFFARDRNWDGRTVVLSEATLGRKGKHYNYSPLEKFFHWVLNPAQTLEIPRRSLDLVSDDEAKSWVNFLESNDLPRLLTYYPNMSESAYASLIKYTFISPGVPAIAYGVETGLAVPYHIEHKGMFGIGGHPFNRPMMIWPGDRGWNAKLYDTTRKMAHLRQDYPVLRYGDTRFLDAKNSHRDKDMFMLREGTSNGDRILYAYSTFGGEFVLPLGSEDVGEVSDVETNANTEVTDGVIRIKLEPEESKVFILKK